VLANILQRLPQRVRLSAGALVSPAMCEAARMACSALRMPYDKPQLPASCIQPQQWVKMHGTHITSLGIYDNDTRSAQQQLQQQQQHGCGDDDDGASSEEFECGSDHDGGSGSGSGSDGHGSDGYSDSEDDDGSGGEHGDEPRDDDAGDARERRVTRVVLAPLLLHCPGLRELRLAGVRVQPGGAAAAAAPPALLEGFGRLAALRLARCDLGDRLPLHACSQVQVLQLVDVCGVGSVDLLSHAHMQAMPCLRSLQLSVGAFYDRLAHLTCLAPTLQDLDVSGLGSARHLGQLRHLHALSSLRLDFAPAARIKLTQGNLPGLSRLAGLRRLRIADRTPHRLGGRANTVELARAVLARVSQLESLELGPRVDFPFWSNDGDEAPWRAVTGSHKQLTSLRCCVPLHAWPDVFNQARPLDSLRKLTIVSSALSRHADEISPAHLLAMTAACSGLQVLSLDATTVGYDAADDERAGHNSRWVAFRALCAQEAACVTNARSYGRLLPLASLAALTALTVLHAHDVVRPVVQRLPQLRALALLGTPRHALRCETLLCEVCAHIARPTALTALTVHDPEFEKDWRFRYPGVRVTGGRGAWGRVAMQSGLQCPACSVHGVCVCVCGGVLVCWWPTLRAPPHQCRCPAVPACSQPSDITGGNGEALPVHEQLRLALEKERAAAAAGRLLSRTQRLLQLMAQQVQEIHGARGVVAAP
jgi:hypothetical protein